MAIFGRKEKSKKTKCQFCGKQFNTSSGNLQTATVISGNNIDDIFAEAEKMAQNMLSQKIVCSSCGTVFCLECGNNEGQKRGTGKTHCPKCGKVGL